MQNKYLGRQHFLASDNAMTEVALALAMGFFAIMILTLVSMSATPTDTSAQEASIAAAVLRQNETAPSERTGVENVTKQDVLIIYYQGKFLDQKLEVVNPQSLTLEPSSRVILALNPSLPMVEALSIRSKISAENLIVSTLDARWLERLGENQ